MGALPISLAGRVLDADALLARALRHDDTLATGWLALDAALPSGGLPRGVIEIAAPRVHGCTAIALATVRAAHARDAQAWCAWIDPDATLFAPGVERAWVDRARLLVVRPPRADLGRIAVKVVSSGAFDVVVIDHDAVAMTREHERGDAERKRAPSRGARRGVAPEILVRRLAVAAEPSGARVLLLTDSTQARAAPWPVTMRLELEPEDDAMRVRVAKDRRGGRGVTKTVPYDSRPEKIA
jgi:hypothetical protein